MDQQHDKEIDDALVEWQEQFEEGRDLQARDLRPNWTADRLNALEQRIAVRRESLRRVQPMFDDNDEVKGSVLGFVPGQVVPGTDYELEEFLGRGGFGEVWKARKQGPKHEKVALKFCNSERVAKTLLRESDLLARIRRDVDHPGFVRLLETHLKNPPYFLAYEYIPGGDFRRLLSKRKATKGPFSPQEAATIMQHLAGIVAFAHGLNGPIVHRDLKPENILVADADCFPPKLQIADFGIGGVAVSESVSASMKVSFSACTPAYASEELFVAVVKKKSRKALNDDVYALGVIWYELLSAKSIIRGRPDSEDQETDEVGDDHDADQILRRCFDYEPKRPKNAGEMVDEITKLFSLPPLRPDTHGGITTPVAEPPIALANRQPTDFRIIAWKRPRPDPDPGRPDRMYRTRFDSGGFGRALFFVSYTLKEAGPHGVSKLNDRLMEQLSKVIEKLTTEGRSSKAPGFQAGLGWRNVFHLQRGFGIYRILLHRRSPS